MSMFQMLGLDDKRILTGGHCTESKNTEGKTCHWLKVNTKPVRTNAPDGARFPQIIHFTCCVDETEYHGNRYVNRNV